MPIAADGTVFDVSGNANGIPIVLVHGLGLSRRLWDDHLEALETHCRVVNYDLYGHGESGPPPETASLSIFANQIKSLMDHVGFDRAAIIGFSIGGMINRRFAMDFPDRVSALAILNSPHNRGDQAQELVESRARKVREQGALATLDDALKRWFTDDYLKSGKGPEHVRQWRNQVDAESYAQAAWVLANGVRELITPQTQINAPTLVMTCENDTGSTPEMSAAISDEIRGSEKIIVPDLRHLGLMENPAAFFEPILGFLERKLA